MEDKDGTNVILCLCIPENKMLVYSETGILIEYIHYQKLADECGKPICISENGRVLIFRRSDHDSVIYLVTIDLSVAGNEITKYKTIDMNQIGKSTISSNHFIHEQKSEIGNFWKEHVVKKGSVLEEIDFDNVDLDFKLNDNGDILIQFKLQNP